MPFNLFLHGPMVYAFRKTHIDILVPNVVAKNGLNDHQYVSIWYSKAWGWGSPTPLPRHYDLRKFLVASKAQPDLLKYVIAGTRLKEGDRSGKAPRVTVRLPFPDKIFPLSIAVADTDDGLYAGTDAASLTFPTIPIPYPPGSVLKLKSSPEIIFLQYTDVQGIFAGNWPKNVNLHLFGENPSRFDEGYQRTHLDNLSRAMSGLFKKFSIDFTNQACAKITITNFVSKDVLQYMEQEEFDTLDKILDPRLIIDGDPLRGCGGLLGYDGDAILAKTTTRKHAKTGKLP